MTRAGFAWKIGVLVIVITALLLGILIGGGGEVSGEAVDDDDGGGEDFLGGVEDFLNGLDSLGITGLIIILVVVIMFVLAIMNKRGLILNIAKHFMGGNRCKKIDWSSHKILFISIGILTTPGIVAWVIEFSQPRFGFFLSFVAITFLLLILFMASILKVHKGSSSDKAIKKAKIEAEEVKILMESDSDLYDKVVHEAYEAKYEEWLNEDSYGIWKFLAWATGPHSIAGIVIIILNFRFKEWDLLEICELGLHTIALSAVVAVLVIFIALVFYFCLSTPKNTLRISCKWRVPFTKERIEFFPTLLLQLICLSSITYFIYSIMKGFGVAKEGNAVGDIYNFLDRGFGYEVTIPQTDFKVYMGHAFLVISAIMALGLAYRLTFIFNLWATGVHSTALYAFVIFTGLSLVFAFEIMFQNIEIDVNGSLISIAMIMTGVKIMGWVLALLSCSQRISIRRLWIRDLTNAALGGKIKSEKKLLEIWVKAFEIYDPKHRYGSRHWEYRRDAATTLGAILGKKADCFEPRKMGVSRRLVDIITLKGWRRRSLEKKLYFAIDELIDTLEPADAGLSNRTRVIIALHTIGERKAKPYLNLIEDDNTYGELTWGAVESKYGKLEAKEEEKDLVAIEDMRSDESIAMDLLIKYAAYQVQKEVIVALWSSGSGKAIPYLEALQDDECVGELAWEAVEGIKHMGEGFNYSDKQYEVAERSGRPVNHTSRAGIEFALVPRGDFIMGSREVEDNDAEPHQVTISESFYMGKYPVTQAQWKMIMGDDPSHFRGNNRPVEKVSWDDCQEFVKKLNVYEKEDKYRLPTEAEWEYACRAGSITEYCFEDNEEKLRQYAFFEENGLAMTMPVGWKKPNRWGLYDMHGNVYEWCHDWYGDYPTSPVTDPSGPSSGSARVGRGGSWSRPANSCASANRGRCAPYKWHSYLGFRLVRSINHIRSLNITSEPSISEPGDRNDEAPGPDNIGNTHKPQEYPEQAIPDHEKAMNKTDEDDPLFKLVAQEINSGKSVEDVFGMLVEAGMTEENAVEIIKNVFPEFK